MTVAFDIDRCSIRTHLTGAEVEAAPLEARLRALMSGEVLNRAAEALSGELAEDAVICVPRLPLHVVMTLEEALSATAVDRWADVLAQELKALAQRPGAVWTFDDRWDFLAAYLRFRLSLLDAPAQVFSGLTALDLLTPAQATQEALRQWPEIWPRLARGGAAQAVDLVTALQEAGGQPVLTTLLEEMMMAGTDPVGSATDTLIAELERLSPELLEPLIAIRGHLRSAEPSAAWLIVALTIAAQLSSRSSPRVACEVAAVLSLLLAIQQPDGEQDWAIVEQQLTVAIAQMPQASLRQAAQEALARITQTPQGLRAVGALSRRLASAETTPHDLTTARHARSETADNPDEPPAQPNAAQIWASPVAGIGLCLPFLTENRIGADLPPSVRLGALAILAEGALPDAADDPMLQAIAGFPEDGPQQATRPAGIDLIFVPETRRALISDAPFGAARLALWLEARLAASLPGLAASGRGFLQTQFLHRPGRVVLDDARLRVDIDAMPLRPAVEMSGLLGEASGRADWLAGQSITLSLREIAP